MSDMTPDKIAKLTALMASAPPEAASRLFELFERMHVKGSQAIPSGVLISALRDAQKTEAVRSSKPKIRIPSFERLFFEPFENLFENGPFDSMLPGGLSRTGLAEAWQIIAKHLAPTDFNALKARATEAILTGDITTGRNLAQQLRIDILANLEGRSTAELAALAQGQAAKAFLIRLGPLLLAQSRGRDVWALALDRQGELSETGVGALCTKLLVLNATDREAARELLLLTLATLPNPSQTLKVFLAALNGVNDRRIEEANFGVVSRRLCVVCARAGLMIDQAIWVDMLTGAPLASAIAQPLQVLDALERLGQTTPDSVLCQEVLDICRKVGDKLVAICAASTQTLKDALPVETVKNYALSSTHKPRLEREVDTSAIEATVTQLAFIVACRPLGTIGEFGRARDEAFKYASAHLSDVSEYLLRASHLTSGHQNYALWLASTVRLLEPVQGIKAAQAFQRRALAMATAA